MNHNLEYTIMIFLAVLLIILFLWSENGRYQAEIGATGALIIDTRTGDSWTPGASKVFIHPKQ